MPHSLQITYGPYDIVRMPASDDDDTLAPARYVIRRPDGSVCCEGVTWAEVERAIAGDERARRTAPGGPPAG